MDGIINILKPPGMSSHDVVNFVRRLTGLKKVGHTGTLDPGAAGVLVICLGKATRLAQYLLVTDKEYRAEVTFGISTDSGDAYGEVEMICDASMLDRVQVEAALCLFTGEIEQVPPMTAAVRWQGKKLYELARAGKVIDDRPARTVYIYSLEIVRGDGWGTPHPRVLLNLSCSKGTYVRTLSRDIGLWLKCGAYMSFLVRTRAGVFQLAAARTLEELEDAARRGDLQSLMTTVDDALAGLPVIRVRESAVAAVRSGRRLYLPGIVELPENLANGQMVRLYDSSGLLSVARAVLDPAGGGRYSFSPFWIL
jgi:tRNA pseudouridine55 synthase